MELLQQIAQVLKENGPTEAARLIAAAAADHRLPCGSDLPALLKQWLGRAGVVQIVTAFVNLPCFCCKKGRIECEACQGHRILDDGDVCSACLGFGLARCDFCDGSGQAAIQYVPVGLHLPVLRGRLSGGVKRMSLLLAQPVNWEGNEVSSVISHLCQQLLALDTQMGVFENVLVATRGEPDKVDSHKPVATQLRQALNLAQQAEERYREILSSLARVYSGIQTDSLRTQHDRRRAEAFTTYYQALCDSGATLSGTGLEHPFLHQALTELEMAGQTSRLS